MTTLPLELGQVTDPHARRALEQISLRWPLAGSSTGGGTPGPPGPAGPAGPEGPIGPTGPTGATGATGPQGSQGVQGVQGTTGPQGATGSTGSQGPAGAPGSIWRSGAGAPAGALGVVGDWYEDTATGDIYEKTGASTYTLRDNLTGPQGPQGSAGAGAPDATTTTKGSIQLAGDLAGTAASPQIAAGAIVNADVNAAAAIARSKLDFGSGLVNADIAAGAAIAKTKLAALAIVNADVDPAAAIVESKLSLATDAAAATGSRRTLGTGALQAAAGTDPRFPTRVTSLPGSPVDGQHIIYVADATNGVLWPLRYNAGSASAYKWEFVGGSPLTAEVATTENTASTTYADLTTVGPQVTIPLAGDYLITGGIIAGPTTSVFLAAIAAVKLGAAATSDNDRLAQAAFSTANNSSAGGSTLRRNALAAAAVLKMQYRVTAGTGFFGGRYLAVVPVRVG
jgi:hypothetical protein